MKLRLIHTVGGRFTFFLCSLFFCLHAKGQLAADFKADVVKGCAPVLVSFTDMSTGNPTSWKWDLGNGNVSSAQNPGTLYFNPGTYNIKLIISNASGTDSIVKNNFIFISNDPDVNFKADNFTGCAPFHVKFTDQSNAGFGNIVKWEWDFGDGATSMDQSPPHAYTADGDITVILKVTNSTGCIKVLRKPAFIHVNPSPAADFTSGSLTSCKPPAQVNFANTSAGSFTASDWSFGDRNTSSETNPSHTYMRAGNYQVKLIVSNQFGCADTATKPTVIGTVSPDFTSPDTVCEGAAVQFLNTSFPATASANWVFADGTSSADISPLKVFSTAGNSSVKLVNNFGACIDSVTKSIYIRPNQPVDFSLASPPAGCSVPAGVTFNPAVAGASSYLWDFGDGNTSEDASPQHSYTQHGSYTVSLTITGTNGCTVTATKPDFVSLIPAKINGFSNLPFRGCLPYTQNFSASITSPEPVKTYVWNFGDGSSSNLAAPSYTYAKDGSFDVSLIITTANGCTDTLVYPAAIIAAKKPSAAFTAAPRNACAYELVGFTDQSSGMVNNWFWQFGDNFSSNAANPQHNYKDTGFFQVTLIAGNYYCYDTITIRDYIYIRPPVARFDVAYNCDTPFVRTFTDKSVAAETFAWDFGDGSTANIPDPVHTYPAAGTYNTSLHVTNSTCHDDVFYIVNIIDEKPNFTLDNKVTCRNTVSTFTATSINEANIAFYTWDFGDSTGKITSTGPLISHTYLTSGVYSPSLTVTDKLGCERTVEKDITATVNGPTSAFANPEGTCINSSVSFTDQCKPYGIYPLNSWFIDYGDGSADSSVVAPSFAHTYTSPGNYDVWMVVKDTYGCSDSTFIKNAITITEPVAAFSISDSIACDNSPIDFTDNSLGSIVNYTWVFGDGDSAYIPNPSHAFATGGSHNISLLIEDQYGCTDTATKRNGVVTGNAKAIFSMSDSILNCPAGQISFINNSVYSKSVSWNFDDGSSSAIANPSHYFLTARSYNVKLIAKGFGSCADSTMKTIVVNGPAGSFTYSPLFKCSPTAVDFVATVSNNNKLVWDFGDGTTSSTSSTAVSHTYTTVQKYLPRLLLTDTGINCTVTLTGSDTITVSGVNTSIKSHPNIFCDSAGIQFSDSSVIESDLISSFSWNFGDGATSNLPKPFHNYIAPGIYNVSLAVTTTGGCVDSAATNLVKVIKSPELQVAAPTAICLDKPADFSAVLLFSDTSQLVWNWNFGNGESSSLQLPAPQFYYLPGGYFFSVSVANSSGCTDTLSGLITVHPLPAVSAGADTAVCLGQTLTLQASGAQNYLWQSDQALSCSSCSNPVASSAAPIVFYTVTGTSAEGCTKSDTIIVQVIQPFTVTAAGRDTICKGQSAALLAAGADNYIWSPSTGLSNANSPNTIARPDATTLYSVIGYDYQNCFADTAYVPVTVYPIPVFSILQDNMTITAGNSVTLTTKGSPDIIAWKWEPPTGLSCSTCAAPVAAPTGNITYRATAYNRGGCGTSDEISILTTCSAGNLYMPNTFSPNGDGSNDFFFPRGRGIAGVKRFQVFGRWGNIIYQKTNFSINDPRYGWDGMYNGQPAPADVYIYHVEVICSTGELLSFKGDISLLR